MALIAPGAAEARPHFVHLTGLLGHQTRGDVCNPFEMPSCRPDRLGRDGLSRVRSGPRGPDRRAAGFGAHDPGPAPDKDLGMPIIAADDLIARNSAKFQKSRIPALPASIPTSIPFLN